MEDAWAEKGAIEWFMIDETLRQGEERSWEEEKILLKENYVR